MIASVLCGLALIALGLLVLRSRGALTKMRQDVARDDARYGSLLNPERANRERDAWLSASGRREISFGVVLFGGALVAIGVAVIVAGWPASPRRGGRAGTRGGARTRSR